MKKFLAQFPWFYALFTFYPLLYLWSANISEIQPQAVIRPLLFTLAGSAVLFGILYLVFRNLMKAGTVGTLLLIAFFSYGHVYYETRRAAALNFLNHHSILLPFYGIIFGLAIWAVLRLKKYGRMPLVLNGISLVLVAMQVFNLSYTYIRSASAGHATVQVQSQLHPSTALKDMPDIYVIVLDTYMRSDALKQDLGYDNSAFLDQLTQMGFYVPTCSHPNYTFTYASISALLNMEYIPDAYTKAIQAQVNFSGLLHNNLVSRQLKSIGYKTVAFQEEYPLLEMDNADVLIGVNHPDIRSQYRYPFEVLYKQTTAAIVFNALDPNGKVSNFFWKLFTRAERPAVDLSGISGPQKDFVVLHTDSTLFILDHLSTLPSISGPKFAYVHLFIPHYPYVFGPDGQIQTDPGFYSNDRGSAMTDTYEKTGYVNQVQYIDSRMIPILQTLISRSANPPIILLMGDHGLKNNNRRTNLMAFYLPENGSKKLYPAISPVNAFRLVFDQYFGGDYPLLPDQTYDDDTVVLPDSYPGCAP